MIKQVINNIMENGVINTINKIRSHLSSVTIPFYKYKIIHNTTLENKIYTVSPDRIESLNFKIFLPYGATGVDAFERLSYHQTYLLEGTYEEEVLATLYDLIDNDTVFWEVGARFGYFSLAVASDVNNVIAIEPSSKCVEYLEKSIAANEFGNINIVDSKINSENTLDDLASYYGVPDVILIDIEGWEYEALLNSDELLTSDAIWIIEVHRNPADDYSPASYSSDTPDKVLNLLKERGCTVEVIDDSNGDNFNIIVE